MGLHCCTCFSLVVASGDYSLVAHGLSCFAAWQIFLDQESKLSPALAGRFFTTEPPGKPLVNSFFISNRKADRIYYSMFSNNTEWYKIKSKIAVSILVFIILPRDNHILFVLFLFFLIDLVMLIHLS